MEKKYLKVNLILILFLILVIITPSKVMAANEHGLELKAVVCDKDKYNDSDPVNNYIGCYDDYKAGLLDSYVKNNGDEIEPGTIVMNVVTYKYNGVSEVTGINAALTYDPTIWSPIIYDETFVSFDNTDALPSGNALKKASWENYVTLDTNTNEVIVYINEGSKYHIALSQDTEIGYFFMTVNNDAPGGSNADIKFNTKGGNVDVVNGSGDSLEYTTTDITFNIPGEEISHDATLGTLSVTNGSTTYQSNPSFTAGSSQKTYDYVVPNNINFVNLSATANHSQASVLSGGIGKKNLNVGNNTFNLTVTAAYGNTETYTINVYRLSNDATLSAINLTNSISFGNMISGTYTYQTTIPYAINSTSVSATTNHKNAYVDSGLGNWNLPNSGNLSNNKTLVVKAENCLSKYASVPGNTCTTQNYNLTINREAASNNSYLKTLTVDGNLVNNFNKTVQEYDLGQVANNKTSLLLNGLVDDTGKATISGLGTVNLKVGANEFTIKVTAQDNTTRNYKLKVYRLSNENKLSNLTITSTPQATMSPTFQESFNGTYSYNYDATVTDVTITATVKDTGKASVAIYDNATGATTASLNTKTETFSIATTDVSVVVTAEDGTVNTYTINLVRSKSTDSSLKSLTINHGTLTPAFNQNTRTYTATVDADITEIDVNAVPNSLYGSIKSITGNTNLNFGTNQIEVVVEAENKTTSSYIINVTRKEYDIATLDDIKVDGTSVKNFNKDTFEYTLDSVEFNKKDINIETSKTNSYATVKGDGNVTLKTGNNQILITVTAQNGTEKVYKLNIKRARNSDTSISNLTVAGIEAVNTDVGIYEVTVPNSVTVLTPNDVLFTTSSDAKVTKNQTLQLVTTMVNDYRFTVTAEDGTEQEYSIKVTRTKANDSRVSRINLTIGNDDSRYCLVDSSNNCRIEVPVNTLQFQLSAEISDTASVSPVNGTTYQMPASESTKEIILTVTAEDGTITAYTVNVIRQKSSNNNLADLKVDGTTVKNFNPLTQTYELTVPGTTSEVVVSATVEDTDKATITTDLSNPFTLEFDTRNKIEVTVKSEDNTTKTYTIYITRSHRQDITLKDLTINGTTITDFTSTKDNYTLEDLPYNTHQLNIVATPNDDLATKTGDGLVRINTGNNKITITVIAHDTNITHDYIINVKRNLNDDTSIKNITLAGVNATYNQSTKKYEVTVPNNITEANSTNLIVEVNDPITSLDKKATVSFVSTPLVTTSTNEVVITVTAENGTIKPYTLVVTRTKSNVATLDSLTVTNGSFNPSFNKDTLEYNVTVPVETTDFDVNAITTEPHASITSGIGHYSMTESTKKIEVVVASEDLTETKTYKLNISRTKSSDNTLSSITVSEGSLSPAFNQNTTSYTVNVGGSVDSIDIEATLSDSRAKILSGTGTHDLNVGNNTITITVESESGAKQNYVITVVRAKKENNDLLTLTVDGNPVKDFNKDTLEYTLDNVLYTKTSIEIGATAVDNDATISGLGAKGLTTGLNTFEVIVTAQNGTTKTYKINVTRNKNNNANLSLLAVTGYALVPTFNSGIYDYEVTVESTKETLSPTEVTAIPEDSNATIVKQEAITLSTTSDNLYTVTVTAEDGKTVKTYTIKVIRPKSSDASLKEVKLTGATLSPSFVSNKYEYTITVPYGSTDFSIEGVANYNKTTVVGNGNYSLSDNQVILTTTAEDGTTLTYNFTVIEALSKDATLSNLTVTGYPLDKTFHQTTLDYSLGDLPYGTTQLKINATPNNALSTIEYYVDGVKQASDVVTIPSVVGNKVITVVVTAADGLTKKTYNISYNIIPSSNNYLISLVPSIGSIDFIKTKENYNLTVENEVTSIDLAIETEDSNATITVNGESSFTPKTITVSDLVVGNNPVSIIVKAQDNSPKTYNIIIKRLERQASTDANLSSLNVENYELDKKFNMDTLEYSIGKIPFSLETLTINATPNMGSSKISYLVNGVKQTSNVVNIPKIEGTSAITVQVTAEDGITIKNYKITYEKEASTNAYLSNIIVSEGSLIFNKNTFLYTINVDRTVSAIDITAITEDNTAIMKMNGTTYTSPHTLTLSPLLAGNTEVIILITSENGTVLTYKVIVNKEADPASTITSINYGHTITNGYIKTVKLNTTGIQLKNQLDNENEYLEIWDADETRRISDDEKLATGMIVKLVIDGVEKDRKYIVIKGDTSGDGEIDLFDAVKILNDYLSRAPLTGAYREAAYVTDDDDIDLFDSVMILNHYLGRVSLY
ncbi:MAG: cadherin-like beta sandwich domain-containing protein [Tenericutes bacterium]|nr:cadherin-like beta sandwich domain-containing protein [Mycoplasmatota bacterium]